MYILEATCADIETSHSLFISIKKEAYHTDNPLLSTKKPNLNYLCLPAYVAGAGRALHHL